MANTTIGLREARGKITLAQEDRFRLQMADGRSILFISAPGTQLSLDHLAALADSGDDIVVHYHGDPESGPVAENVRLAI